MKDSLSAFFSPQSPLRLLWRLFCEWEEEQELSGINVLFYRGCFFSLLVSICQWGERVEWVWGSFHREGLLWTLWIGKERVTLAVHNEKKKKDAYWSFQNFDSHSPTTMDWCFDAEYSSYHRPSVFPAKQWQGTGSEEFLQAARPGNLRFPACHANARCH